MEEVICEFCGKKVKNQKSLYSHRKTCKKYQDYKNKLQELEVIVRKNIIEGKDPSILFKVEDKDNLLVNTIQDIYKDLGEIRGLLRRLIETTEMKKLKIKEN